MLTSDFNFDLPDRCIAHQPARPRDAARLLVVGAALEDRLVRDLPDLLRPGDMLVSNDTRVIPAQLSAMRGNARIGITLDRPRPDGAWHQYYLADKVEQDKLDANCVAYVAAAVWHHWLLFNDRNLLEELWAMVEPASVPLSSRSLARMRPARRSIVLPRYSIPARPA